jgi:hypothetical protein
MDSKESDKFTSDAIVRWEKVPASAQKAILDTVWCGQCCTGVPIVLIKGKMKDRFLILEGICKYCGKKVVRSLEPEQ